MTKTNAFKFCKSICAAFGLISALFLFPAQGTAQKRSAKATLEKAIASPETTKRLELKNAKLREIPPEVFKLTNLHTLDLSRNKIKVIPPEIANLKNLEILIINKNRIEILPKELFELVRLKQLIIGNNSIEFIPPEIGNLEFLEVLDAWGNYIEFLPDDISNLKRLRKIDLRVNPINDETQEQIKNMTPGVSSFFSMQCNCGR